MPTRKCGFAITIHKCPIRRGRRGPMHRGHSTRPWVSPCHSHPFLSWNFAWKSLSGLISVRPGIPRHTLTLESRKLIQASQAQENLRPCHACATSASGSRRPQSEEGSSEEEDADADPTHLVPQGHKGMGALPFAGLGLPQRLTTLPKATPKQRAQSLLIG